MMFVRAVPLDSIADVQRALQTAIEIEHAVIPPYLTAMFSLSNGSNEKIRSLLHDVVVQEMEHMALAANVLNATGGHPVLDDPSFVPRYPNQLPFQIGDENGQVFTVDLAPFSKQLIHDTFMRIEEPDFPLSFPVKHLAIAATAQQFKTIGDFYRDVAAKLQALGSSVIIGDQGLQVTGFLDGIFAVRNLDGALRAIDTIVAQGEGTTTTPLQLGGELAHYYRFAEIWNGKSLVPDDTVPQGYSYSGDEIPFDTTKVLPILKNPAGSDYRNAPVASRLSDQFNSHYSSLLRSLHGAFNGQPGTIADAVGLMFDCKIVALAMMNVPVDGTGLNAAPTYEYR